MKCKDKNYYFTKAKAKKKAREKQIQYKQKFTVYKCNECNLYHLHSWNIERIQLFRKIH